MTCRTCSVVIRHQDLLQLFQIIFPHDVLTSGKIITQKAAIIPRWPLDSSQPPDSLELAAEGG